MTRHTGDDNSARSDKARGWVPLVAEEIREHTFHETPFGRRGYRPEEVDLFLGRVAGEIERWTAAYAEAQNEIHRLRYYFRNQGVDLNATRVQELPDAAAALLTEAQAQAGQIIASAQTQACAIWHDARSQAEAIVARAREEAGRTSNGCDARASDAYVGRVAPPMPQGQ